LILEPHHHHHHHQLQGRPSWPFQFRILTSEWTLVRLFGGGINPTQGVYPHRRAQHRKTRTHIHALSRIRNHDPSVRAVEDSTCLRQRGHWDRLFIIIIIIIIIRYTMWELGFLFAITSIFKSRSSNTMDLWNVGILSQHYTASQPRRHRLETPTLIN
jgi:hypothetical protein